MSSIGDLEKRAGIEDRKAFWMQFAHLPDGFEAGVNRLQELARARVEPGTLSAPMPAASGIPPAVTLFALAAVNIVAAGILAGRALL